ncbi:MAG TPA: hypothetical protein VGY55_21215 [Pirellulales bacterium]|jgi:hypothetical protein|nr:hypothetical protein [Pirellulales bacterium]
MQIEQRKAEPPKPKRRWFQYSLRTLLVVVTVLIVFILQTVFFVYAGRQALIVRERKRLLSVCPVFAFEEAPLGSRENQNISVIRRWLGDKAVLILDLADSATDDQVKQCLDAFPEVEVNAPLK